MLEKFPCRLKKLTLSGTLFLWKDMDTLGSLEELEVLKLDDYAFKGEEWDLRNNVVFKRLQYLRIGRTNLKTWNATEKSFPALRSLVLRNCNVIERIPEAFAKIHTLKVMELFHVSESAVNSAKEVKIDGFELIITSLLSQAQRETAMDILIEQAVSEVVDRLVQTVAYNVKRSRGLDMEIKDLTSDIETFNARLVETYKNPFASVNVLIVKKFQTLVNEAEDAIANYFALRKKHEDKALRKFLGPSYVRNVKSCASEIQSLMTKLNMIRQEHENDLQSLAPYKKNVVLSLQGERQTVFDKVIEEGVKQVVNRLVQTVEDNVNLVCDKKSEIKDMTTHIETFTAKLEEACNNPNAHEHRVLRVIVKKFRLLVNEAEYAVANYFALEKKHGENVCAKSLEKIPLCGKVNVYASEIQSISSKVNTIRKDHEKDLLYLLDYKHIDLPDPKARQVVHENKIVGFNDDLETIKARLMKASENFVVIPIVGMGGIGKTTIAKTIFDHPEIKKNFTHCIWVCVSHDFQRKKIFIDILHQISKHTEDFSIESEDLLKAKIKNLLEAQRYFIVLEDVWGKADWDSLKVAFPENLNGSTILVTTRYVNAVDSTWEPHHLRLLSNDDGWLIIEDNVFGKKGCNDPLLEGIGRRIAEQCYGLPLSLVVVAGILRSYTTIDAWQRVAESLTTLDDTLENQRLPGAIKLSYNNLSHEMLKNCFLYCAYFPMDHEIAVWKLIRLWIAEEFIPTIDEWGYPIDAEVEAQNYLNNLVDRSLVIVMKKSADGQIKTCCMHDMVYDFCKSEATRKMLFQVMDEGQRLDENTCSTRRLCFHSSTMDILDEKDDPSHLYLSCYNKKRSPSPFGNHVHSLLLLSSEESEIHLTQEQLAAISNSFPLLKVLNIEHHLRSSLLPNELYGLYLLRYLAITANIELLPKSFKNLRELETLVIKTTEKRLQIDGGIWNMEMLRHVHTNTSAELPSPPKRSKRISRGTNIRTLCTISPASCTKKIFKKTPNLQKLGVRGNLSELLEEKKQVCLFNNLQMLDSLENLKLHGNSEKVLKVPMLDKFPSRLRKLTISGTLFHWDDMTVLGSLEELRVLKLDDNAFLGENWDLNSDVIFNRLQYLRIGRTNLVTWIVEEESFPVLECLVLKNCTSLESIPNAFADVESLTEMELFYVGERVINSARKIQEEKRDFGSDLSIRVHKQTYEEENVNTSGFDHPSTSMLSQEIEDYDD